MKYLKQQICQVLEGLANCPKYTIRNLSKGEKPVVLIEIHRPTTESFNSFVSVLEASNLFDIVADGLLNNICVELKYSGEMPNTYTETADEFLKVFAAYSKKDNGYYFSQLKALFHHYCEQRGITTVIEHPLYGGGKITYTYNIKNSSWGNCGIVNWHKLIVKTKDLPLVDSAFVFS